MILDGKKLAGEIKEGLKKEIEELVGKGNPKPGLAMVMVGENKASTIYVSSKIKYCEEIGIESKLIKFPKEIDEETLLNEIEKLNSNNEIHGILVQLPLPEHISAIKVIETISPTKDADCFTEENLGKLFLNLKNGVYPCTPEGIIELLDHYELEIEGRDVVILGRSNIVGKPLALMFINRGGTVTICNSKTKALGEKIKKADIVISAIGHKHFITGEMIKEGAIVVDVGINRTEEKIYGDVDFESVKEIASYITPVPGGVGPMTVAMLFKNCINLYKKYSVKK